MNRKVFKLTCLLLSTIGLVGCLSTSKSRYASAPMPPQQAYDYHAYNNIQPAAGSIERLNNYEVETRKSCSFSSFHRKNTVGYELDGSRHISFSASPSFDLFDADDFEMKLGLRFTKALGGPANKRPKCTYGTGYYGLLPYAMNDDFNLGGLTDEGNIRSFVQEKLDERERRRKEREAERAFSQL